MYARQLLSEETYTLSEARKIIRKEQKLRREVTIKRIQFFILGLVCLLLCSLVPFACNGDVTVWIFSIPMTISFFVKAIRGDVEV